MTMSVEPGLLDANILMYAVDSSATQHPACRALLDTARDPGARLYVNSQILCEFYSVITNPRRVAAPRKPAEARDAIVALLSLPGIQVLSAPARIVAGWLELLRHRSVTGGDIFDLQIVGTCSRGWKNFAGQILNFRRISVLLTLLTNLVGEGLVSRPGAVWLKSRQSGRACPLDGWVRRSVQTGR